MFRKEVTFDFKAPYYKKGVENKNSKNVWLIFHGYGQLVEDFHHHFSILNTDEHILIFPQALSKFYLKGIGQKIGATWMTSHDREYDINNYINYLDHIYALEIESLIKNHKLFILGFSQGVHTATRWIYQSNIKYDKLILWGAPMAHEMNAGIVKKSFNVGEQIFVVGDQDRFIDASALETIERRYEKIGFKYKLIKYSGTHDIYPEVLAKLV